MDCVASDVLEDPAYSVPVVPPATSGVGWLRGAVVRFSEGEAHRRRRALVVSVIDRLGLVAWEGTPTQSLLAALGLPADLEAGVALIAAAYQPHLPQMGGADVAADRLVAACGGKTTINRRDRVRARAGSRRHAGLDQRSVAPGRPLRRCPSPDVSDPPARRFSSTCATLISVVGRTGAPGEHLARHLADRALA